MPTTTLYRHRHDRELGVKSREPPIQYAYTATTSPSLFSRMTLSQILTSHTGCVNALCWSEDGRLLASGSDDKHLCIWEYHPGGTFPISTICNALPTSDDPPPTRLLLRIPTRHQANIFSTKFIPQTANSVIATCAGDGDVKLFDIHYSHSGVKSSLRQTWSCHRDRAKRLAIPYGETSLIWSCSEDGTVRQHDFRVSHSCSPRHNCPTPIVDYSSFGMEMNSLSCDPTNGNYFTVAGSDPHIFLHDRRNVKVPVRKFRPKNLGVDSGCHITSCKISEDGREVVGSWSGEFVYLFDLHGFSTSSTSSSCSSESPSTTFLPSSPKPTSSTSTSTPPSFDMTQNATILRNEGQQAYISKNFTKAIQILTHILGTTNTKGTAKSRIEEFRRRRERATDYRNRCRCYLSIFASSVSPCTNTNNGSQSPRKRKLDEDLDLPSEYQSEVVETTIAPELAAKLAASDAQRSLSLYRWTPYSFLLSASSLAAQGLYASSSAERDRLSIECVRTILEYPHHKSKFERVFEGMLEVCAEGSVSFSVWSSTFWGKEGFGEWEETETGVEVQRVEWEWGIWGAELASRLEHAEDEHKDGGGKEGKEEDEGEWSDRDSDRGPMVFVEEEEETEEFDEDGEEGEWEDDDEDEDVDVEMGGGGMGSDDAEEGDEEEEMLGFGRGRRGEKRWEGVEVGFEKRKFLGGCNVQTVKDVTHLTPHHIASGSDDGSFSIWDKHTSRLVALLKGDGCVVNVIESHPFLPVWAVSGIDDTVKIFEPVYPYSAPCGVDVEEVLKGFGNEGDEGNDDMDLEDDEEEGERTSRIRFRRQPSLGSNRLQDPSVSIPFPASLNISHSSSPSDEMQQVPQTSSLMSNAEEVLRANEERRRGAGFGGGRMVSRMQLARLVAGLRE
ncbi:hypothetical protein HK097_005460, partial [Rhizophlyctis rosea]